MIDQCPRCRAESFDAIELLGVQLERCRGCRGIWFDPGEFEKVVESSRSAGAEVEAADAGGSVGRDSYLPLRVRCPGCGRALLGEGPVRFEFIQHFVMTDRCPGCQGVWLDGSELALISRYIRSEDAAIARAAAGQEGAAAPDPVRGASPTDPIPRRRFWRALIGLDAS